MNLQSVVVVYKRSRFERALERHACSEGELIRVYRHWGLAPERTEPHEIRGRRHSLLG